MHLLPTTAVLATASLPAAAIATAEFSFEPTADTTMFADIAGFDPSWDDVSDAQGVSLWLSTTAGGVLHRALVRFDLGTIPDGMRIVTASLTLYESRARDSHEASLHRLLAPWGEGAPKRRRPGRRRSGRSRRRHLALTRPRRVRVVHARRRLCRRGQRADTGRCAEPGLHLGQHTEPGRRRAALDRRPLGQPWLDPDRLRGRRPERQALRQRRAAVRGTTAAAPGACRSRARAGDIPADRSRLGGTVAGWGRTIVRPNTECKP